MMQHLEKCIWKFREDFGVWPDKIQINEESFLKLKMEAIRMYPARDLKVIAIATEGKFMGVPLEMIEDGGNYENET